MSLEIFWLLGLLAIGVVTFLFAKSVKVSTTRDSETVRNALVWGKVIATLWVIYGGITVALNLLSKG